MLKGGLVADAVAVISSIDPVDGRRRPVDPVPRPRRTRDTEERGSRDVIAAVSAGRARRCIPLLHLAQEQDGYLTEDGMEHVAELLGLTPAEVYGTASFYDMFFTHPVGTYLVSVCTNIACLLNGGYELLEHAEEHLGIQAGGTTPDGAFTLEEVECIAPCGNAPCLTVNWRFFGDVTDEQFDELVDDLPAGRLSETVPPHGTLSRVRRTVGCRRGAGVAAPPAEAPRRPRRPRSDCAAAPEPRRRASADRPARARGRGEGAGRAEGDVRPRPVRTKEPVEAAWRGHRGARA